MVTVPPPSSPPPPPPPACCCSAQAVATRPMASAMARPAGPLVSRRIRPPPSGGLQSGFVATPLGVHPILDAVPVAPDKTQWRDLHNEVVATGLCSDFSSYVLLTTFNN